MKAQFIKCYMLEVFKMEKLSMKEYLLVSWFISWCERFEQVKLRFYQIQKAFPCVISRKEFDATVQKLVEKGFLRKESDLNNVTYTVNTDLIENYQTEHVNNQKMSAPVTETEFNDFDKAMAEYHNQEDSDNVIDFNEYASAAEQNSEEQPAAMTLGTETEKTDMIPFAAVSPFPVAEVPTQKKTKRKMFVIPEIEEVADHMFNFLVKKGLKTIDEKTVQREAEKFWYFYNSRNWKSGKNTMTCWRSAASGWLLRSFVDFEQISQQQQERMSLEEFQKMVNPHGFEFMTMDDLMHPRDYYKKRLAMAERSKNSKK